MANAVLRENKNKRKMNKERWDGELGEGMIRVELGCGYIKSQPTILKARILLFCFYWEIGRNDNYIVPCDFI